MSKNKAKAETQLSDPAAPVVEFPQNEAQMGLFGTEEIDERIEHLAFDEMNLVELPFALLTDSRSKETQGLEEIHISEGGEKLVTMGKGNLPTALAERTVLGLMWMTMAKTSFKESTIRFGLRRLVEDFMYPNRFHKTRASGQLLKRVEQEINRVADTRIHTKRWYDQELRRQTTMNAAIIDYVQVVSDGATTSPKILEMKWGEKLYKSIQAKYTKQIDARTVLSINRPLDLRFYRWLDRQLATKSTQVIKSCQNFARFKLLMRSYKIERGGRTASSYIVSQLERSLERLNNLGFAVRMIIDKSIPDYRLSFEKIDSTQNETIKVDSVGELFAHFQREAHDLSENETPSKPKKTDREAVIRWLEEYGIERSKAMISRCVELHRENKGKDSAIYKFQGLSLYEMKARADTTPRQARKARKKKLSLAEIEERWGGYREEKLAQAEKELSAATKDELEAEGKKQVEQMMHGQKLRFRNKLALQSLIQASVEEKYLDAVQAMDEDTFRENLENETS